MIKTIDFKIDSLLKMKKYPKELFYIGNTKLLQKRKISIIGTRRPNSYTKEFTHKLSSKLSEHDICIVSGAAMGVDAISHIAAGYDNTIAVVANGLNIRYPSVNRNLIQKIEENGLVLSSYKKDEKARKYTFVLRNEIVVALGEILIVTQADLNSGSLSSVKYAIDMGKKVYTLSHRINESLGTQDLVKKGFIEVIYDIDEFVSTLTNNTNKIKKSKDELLDFCTLNPDYETALLKFGDKILEYELEEKIQIKDNKIIVN